ncbi:MAG: DUF1801 domain-containing protein [Polyangiaceae bacterium]
MAPRTNAPRSSTKSPRTSSKATKKTSVPKATKKTSAPKATKKTSAPKATKKKAQTASVRLLAGGNPQIAKGDGDAPVQAYIADMPGWKRAVGHVLDTLITRAVPKVTKAVKWNSPMYGMPGKGFFLGVHVYAKYVKVAFFKGASLKPLPPGTSKQKDVRYLDIREGDALDADRFTAWVKQAASIPGWTP